MTKKVDVAIIGLGHIGKIHIKTILENNFFNLVATCDKDLSFKNILKDVIFFQSHLKMLQKGGFDVVLVATPNYTHSRITNDILNYDYNVILEKPAANSVDELLRIEELAKKKNKHVYYAFHAAFASEVIWFKNFYKNNKKIIGDLISFNSFFSDPYYVENKIVKHAKNLEFPWKDSGPNALSVLAEFIDLSKLKLYNVKNKKIRNQQINHFRIYKLKSNLCYIETAWDNNQNQKVTQLTFQNDYKIELNHTLQTVTEINKNIRRTLIKFHGVRLENHYTNLFNDYIERRRKARFNFDFSNIVHQKLYEI